MARRSPAFSPRCVPVFALLLALVSLPAHAVFFRVTTPALDVAVLPGGFVDIPLTFHNDTAVGAAGIAGTFVMGSVSSSLGYHFEQRSPAPCGAVVSDGATWNGYWHFAVPAIQSYSAVSCTLRVSRDATAFDPLAGNSFLSIGQELVYTGLRIGTLADVWQEAVLVERQVDADAIRTVIDLTIHNDGASDAIPTASVTSSISADLFETVLSGDCTTEGRLANPFYYILIHWPRVAAGTSHACRFIVRTELFQFDEPQTSYLDDLVDPTNGGHLINVREDNYVSLPTDFRVGGVDLDQYGVGGTWANISTSAQGFVLNVQPDLYGPGQSLLFGGWFTYGTRTDNGPRWFTIQGSIDGRVADVPIYRSVGGRFDASEPTQLLRVGTATVGFSACNQGVLRYAFDDGFTGVMPLTRLLPNATCREPDAAAVGTQDSAFSGTWADPSTSAQGLVVDSDPVSQLLFAGWFTFTATPAINDVSGQRWYTLQGSTGVDSADLTLYASEGGSFDTADPATTTAVGTARLTLASCTSAQLHYTFTDGENAGLEGTLDLDRLGNPPTGCAL